MNKLKKVAVCVAVVAAIMVAFFCWQSSWYEEEPHIPRYDPITEKPVEPTVDDVFVVATITTAVVYHTVTPTEMLLTGATRAQEPSCTPVPTNSPVPTVTSLFEDYTTSYGTPGRRKAEVNGTHGWKPLAWYTACNDRSMPQWRLQQIAKTDERGLRIVQDKNGEWRYCVALPVYWAGGSSDDIGRCVDIIMANGATLKCVLGDTKRVWKSVNGEGKYGVGHNEIIEVQCDLSKMNPIVPQKGDASYIGPEWEGDVAEVIALDLFIDGFGKE